MLVLLLALAPAEAARPFFGLEIRPLSRQDLVWVDEQRTSGVAVGEYDGAVSPLLGAFGGAWFNRWVGLDVGLGVAVLQSVSAAGEVERERTWAALRPSADLRFGWVEPAPRRPIPWVLLGVHGNIPTVTDASNGFTAEEQTAADAASAEAQYRLAGLGGRVGFGVDYEVLPGLSLGAVASVGLHRAGYTGGDGTFTSLWVQTEAALRLTYLFTDRRKARGGAPAGDPSEPSAPEPVDDRGGERGP
jgi:hypothetical protein